MTECWVWSGACDQTTPIVRWSQPRRLYPARRYAYELHNELTLPKTHVVKSVCRIPKCITPRHGMAMLRGHQLSKKLGFRKPSYCKRGHEWTEWNTGQSPRQRYCLACHKSANRAALKLPRRQRQTLAAQKRHQAKKLAVVNAAKTACVRCGESDPICLDFHHRDEGTKHLAIAAAVRKWPLKRVMQEIEKCDILCANCHRKLHAERRERREAGS